MEVNKEQTIKAQEWVVMFDGQIKKSEKEIDAYEHHLEVSGQKNEQNLNFDFSPELSENSIPVDIVNFQIWRIDTVTIVNSGKFVLSSIEVYLRETFRLNGFTSRLFLY